MAENVQKSDPNFKKLAQNIQNRLESSLKTSPEDEVFCSNLTESIDRTYKEIDSRLTAYIYTAMRDTSKGFFGDKWVFFYFFFIELCYMTNFHFNFHSFNPAASNSELFKFITSSNSAKPVSKAFFKTEL